MKSMMRIGIFLTLIPLVCVAEGWAETKYVIEHIQINVRTGRSVEHKIVTMIESGQKVQVLEVDKDWSRIKLADGTEGWILSRFLTSSEPRRILLDRLQKKYDGLDNQMRILSEENAFLKEENQAIRLELDTTRKAFDELTANYDSLKHDSADFLKLKTSEQEARLKLQELSNRADSLENEASGLRNQQNIRWFLAGSGVLFMGFLIGSISKRKQRRSSLL